MKLYITWVEKRGSDDGTSPNTLVNTIAIYMYLHAYFNLYNFQFRGFLFGDTTIICHNRTNNTLPYVNRQRICK